MVTMILGDHGREQEELTLSGKEGHMDVTFLVLYSPVLYIPLLL